MKLQKFLVLQPVVSTLPLMRPPFWLASKACQDWLVPYQHAQWWTWWLQTTLEVGRMGDSEVCFSKPLDFQCNLDGLHWFATIAAWNLKNTPTSHTMHTLQQKKVVPKGNVMFQFENPSSLVPGCSWDKSKNIKSIKDSMVYRGWQDFKGKIMCPLKL